MFLQLSACGLRVERRGQRAEAAFTASNWRVTLVGTINPVFLVSAIMHATLTCRSSHLARRRAVHILRCYWIIWHSLETVIVVAVTTSSVWSLRPVCRWILCVMRGFHNRCTSHWGTSAHVICALWFYYTTPHRTTSSCPSIYLPLCAQSQTPVRRTILSLCTYLHLIALYIYLYISTHVKVKVQNRRVWRCVFFTMPFRAGADAERCWLCCYWSYIKEIRQCAERSEWQRISIWSQH